MQYDYLLKPEYWEKQYARAKAFATAHFKKRPRLSMAIVVVVVWSLGQCLFHSVRLSNLDGSGEFKKMEYSKAAIGTLGVYPFLRIFNNRGADWFAEFLTGTSARKGREYELLYADERMRLEELQRMQPVDEMRYFLKQEEYKRKMEDLERQRRGY